MTSPAVTITALREMLVIKEREANTLLDRIAGLERDLAHATENAAAPPRHPPRIVHPPAAAPIPASSRPTIASCCKKSGSTPTTTPRERRPIPRRTRHPASPDQGRGHQW